MGYHHAQSFGWKKIMLKDEIDEAKRTSARIQE